MNKALPGVKIAVLVANGFNEKDLTEAQKEIRPTGADMRIVSMDQGLVNSWNGEAWGLHYAADSALNAALASDYAMLIVPGGRRSVDKLKLTAHTKRFIGGFIDQHKPVAFFGDALELLIHCERAAGRVLAGPEALEATAKAAGASWVETPFAEDGNIITGAATEESRAAYAKVVCAFLVSRYAAEAATAKAA